MYIKISVREGFAKVIFIVSIIGYSYCNLNAQDTTLMNFYRTSGLYNIASPINGSDHWFEFQNNIAFNPNSFFETYKSQFGLNADESMSYINQTHSDYDIFRYRKYYKNLPVEFSSVILHIKNGMIHRMIGSVKNNFDIEINPAITASSAKLYAFSYFNIDTNLAVNQGCFANASSNLVILKKQQSNTGNDCLAYDVTLKSNIPVISGSLYVDANNGNIIFFNSSIDNDNQDVSTGAYTLYNGYQTIVTNPVSGSPYNGNQCTIDNGRKITTTNQCCTYFWDEDGTWNTAQSFPNNYNLKNAGIDLHWGLENAYDFYLNPPYPQVPGHTESYGRLSWDNNRMLTGGGEVTCMFLDEAGANAYWQFEGFLLAFGKGEITDIFNHGPVTCPDDIGHEFTHAVNSAVHMYQAPSPDLSWHNGYDKQYESGALSESFSDIFGEVIEINTHGYIGSWLVGECKDYPVIMTRSFSDPKNHGSHFQYLNLPTLQKGLPDPTAICAPEDLLGQPDTYQGVNWMFEGGPCNVPQYMDNQRIIHTNSGVPNYWFYLLANGGIGTNDVSFPYCVNGISAPTAIERVNKAALIVYKTMTEEINNNPEFIDARIGTETAVSDLYGFTSDEHAQVALAWDAVNVTMPNFNFNYDANLALYYKVEGILADKTAIVSMNNILTNSVTEVESQKEVWFNAPASGSIKLNHGFHAQSGSKFKANTRSDCNVTTAKYGNNVITNNNKATDRISNKGNANNIKSPLEMKLSPNPTADVVTIMFKGDLKESVKIEISSLETGIFLNSLQTTENIIHLDLSNYPAGVYYIKAYNTNETFVKKIVKL